MSHHFSFIFLFLSSADLVEVGKSVKGCPYFGSRQIVKDVELCILPYNYLIDPGILLGLRVLHSNSLVSLLYMLCIIIAFCHITTSRLYDINCLTNSVISNSLGLDLTDSVVILDEAQYVVTCIPEIMCTYPAFNF